MAFSKRKMTLRDRIHVVWWELSLFWLVITTLKISINPMSDPGLIYDNFVLYSSHGSFEIKFDSFLGYELLIVTFSSALSELLLLSSLIIRIRGIGSTERKVHQKKLLPHFCINVTIFLQLLHLAEINYAILVRRLQQECKDGEMTGVYSSSCQNRNKKS